MKTKSSLLLILILVILFIIFLAYPIFVYFYWDKISFDPDKFISEYSKLLVTIILGLLTFLGVNYLWDTKKFIYEFKNKQFFEIDKLPEIVSELKVSITKIEIAKKNNQPIIQDIQIIFDVLIEFERIVRICFENNPKLKSINFTLFDVFATSNEKLLDRIKQILVKTNNYEKLINKLEKVIKSHSEIKNIELYYNEHLEYLVPVFISLGNNLSKLLISREV